MKRLEPQQVGDVLRDAIDAAQLTRHLDEIEAARYWPAIVGPEIASQCMKPYISGGNMTIRVPDAPLRQELTMNRTRLMAEFNRIMGYEVVKTLRFAR